ncbi:hypothetical protein ABZ816_31095 [Actinosynnema sp. NPDC047251]|uniref:hypothetical protein n=1 Tax=Saccharothrix espanaensis TaxID=103731 RepID=UPI00130E7C5E|nr:hypothetical protein [Saccharothrix espanaensis]
MADKGNFGRKYSAASRAHAETVLRAFYNFHLEAGGWPIINPFRWTVPGGRCGATPTTTR